MSLCGRPPYQKGQLKKSRSAARKPNAEELRHWEKVVHQPCVAGPFGCGGRMTIHHCFTGGGGRKNHMLVLPLCHEHHQGRDGIDGRVISKKQWQEKHGSEAELLALLDERLKTPF